MRPDPDGPTGATLVPALELVTPDISDVDLVDGHLRRLTYDLDTPEDDPRRRVAVDAQGWHYLDAEGEVVEDVEVELGRCPAIPFRLTPHHRGDYWGGRSGHKLVEATLQTGRIAAHMGWVRESLNAKLLTLIAEEEALAAQGKIDPRRPMHINDQATEAKALVLDLEVRVAGFVEEMREHAEPVLESFGLPYSAFDPDFAGGNSANLAVQAPGTLYNRAERALMHRVALMLRAYDHPLAIDPDLILARYEATWSELTFADHPLKLLEIQERKMQHGFLGPEEAMIQWNPGLTFAQARERMDDNIASRGRRLQLMAKHNMPGNPGDDGNYVAQLQGRVGQLERDQPTRDEDPDHADPG